MQRLAQVQRHSTIWSAGTQGCDRIRGRPHFGMMDLEICSILTVGHHNIIIDSNCRNGE